MRTFTYWLCFALVAIPSAVGFLAWMLSLIGVALPLVSFLFLFSFNSLVPQIFAPLLPRLVVVVLGYAMLFLVLRRLWLLVAKREGVPHSYSGAPKVLGYVGAWSVVLAAVVLLLSIALRAGSGVPAGLLLLPAMFCIPWAFFLTEALSFRRKEDREA